MAGSGGGRFVLVLPYLLDAWHESAMYSERERAALSWAETLTNIAQTHAPDHTYEEVRRQFSEKELADLSIVIAMINCWNPPCHRIASDASSGCHMD